MPHFVYYFTDAPTYGGAEKALLTLIAGLDRERWQPVLIAHDGPDIAPLLDGARALEVPLWLVPRMPEGALGMARMPSFAWDLRQKHPSVFHAHLTWPRACKYGLMGAMLARVPAIVATEHLFVEVPRNRIAELQQRVVIEGVDRYIAVSREVARQLKHTYAIPDEKLQVVHNAVAAATGVSSPATAWEGANGRPVILTVARLDKQKGHRYLLEAAAQVPEALFVLVGEGEERAALETRVHELNLTERVIFLGFRKDVPALLAACDLFVLPSLYEGLPISVLEAMAAGKPVIATAIGGTDEAVLDGETGLLVPPADPQALAKAIRKLSADPALVRKLAGAAKARVEREFSTQAMVQQVTRLYEELLAQKGAARGSR